MYLSKVPLQGTLQVPLPLFLHTLHILNVPTSTWTHKKMKQYELSYRFVHRGSEFMANYVSYIEYKALKYRIT